MFWKKRWGKIKKMDTLITWLIIGSVVASVFWVATKTKKWKEVSKDIKEVSVKSSKKIVNIFWKTLVKTIWFFNKKK